MAEIQEPIDVEESIDIGEAPFLNLDDYEWGREVPSTLGDSLVENDATAEWLERERQERIVDPLRVEVSQIYGDSFAFLKGDFWQKHHRALFENPDDPDAIFELAKKLADEESDEALQAAKRLIFLPGDSGGDSGAVPKLRWPDHEYIVTLAAWIFRREKNFRAIIKILTDSDNKPRFPKNPTAKRLLARALNELGYYETTAQMISHSHEGELYRDPMLMLNFVRALLALGQDMEILLLFSGANPSFRENARTPFVRPTLHFLRGKRRYDLMLHIVEQMLLANPQAVTDEQFVDFASRAFNEARQFKKSIKLLASSESPMKARFPRNIYCMKNLAYALIWLSRRQDAEKIVDEAIENRLPRSEFFHLDRRLRGGGSPPLPRRRAPSHGRRPGTEL